MPAHVRIGCSVGVSSQALASWLERHLAEPAQVSGLDRSAQRLAVAVVRDRSRRIQTWHQAAVCLPPPVTSLLKSAELYLEDYFHLDLPHVLPQVGFTGVRGEACDQRHRVLVALR